ICDDALNRVRAEEDFRTLIENQIKIETEFIVGDKIPLLQILNKIFGEIQLRRYDLVKKKLFSLGSRIKNIFVKDDNKEEAIKQEINTVNSDNKLEEEQKRLAVSVERRNTRFRVIRALQQLRTKRQENPAKKHGNIPL
ncbi:MAG: hypothetical protein IKN19_08985, partial [Bacteroidaceae bacterium]|nr:hypothetical protein [Bacteroidaceae bacterium]